MHVLNESLRDPLVTVKSFDVKCMQRFTWPSFWGPQVYCQLAAYNNQLTTASMQTESTTRNPTASQYNFPFSNNQSQFDAIQSAVDIFKCNLYSKHASNFEAIFNCTSSYADSARTSFAASSIIDTANCVYRHIFVIIKSVLQPVSELELMLPKIPCTSTINGTEQHFTTTSKKCAAALHNNTIHLNQVLSCNNLVANSSFYENDSFENTYNSTFMEPVNCLLSLYCVLNGSIIESDKLVNYTGSTLIQYYANKSSNNFTEFDGNKYKSNYDWTFLLVIIFIVGGSLGNILVCLAVALDRKLQNVTNYFLFSLAIADLLVSLFVMPLGAIPSFLGKWPHRRYILITHRIPSSSI